MTNELRGSGRTTQMLQEAIFHAKCGDTVYVVMSSDNMVQYAIRLVRHLCEQVGTSIKSGYKSTELVLCLPDAPLPFGSIKIGTSKSLELNLETLRIRDESRNVPIFLDHAITEEIERRLAVNREADETLARNMEEGRFDALFFYRDVYDIS